MATAPPGGSLPPLPLDQEPSRAVVGPATGAIVQVLATIGAGVGVLGFVVFFGGALLWTRFEAAGLPAAEAVSLVPREVLLTEGAAFLAPALLLSLAAVGAVALWTLLEERRDERHIARRMAEIRAAERAAEDAQPGQLAVLADAGDAQAQVERVARGTEASESDLALENVARTVRAIQASRNLGTERDALLAQLRRQTAAFAAGQAARRERERARRTLAGATLLCVLAAGTTLGVRLGSLGGVSFGAVILTAVFSSLLAFAVWTGSGRFSWFGVAAFLATGLTFGVGSLAAAREKAEIVPLAALLTDRAPVAGFLVARTDDELFVGRTRDAPGGARVVVLPRSKLTDLSVGAAMEPDEARASARDQLRRLCEGRERAPADGGPAPQRCTATELAAIPDLVP